MLVVSVLSFWGAFDVGGGGPGGGDEGGPSGRGTPILQQGRVGDAAQGERPAGGEEGFVRHRDVVAVTVAGAGDVVFGGTGAVADGFHDGEQVAPLGAFDVCGVRAARRRPPRRPVASRSAPLVGDWRIPLPD